MQPSKHFRKQFSFRFANGAAGADLIQTAKLPWSAEILHIKQVNSSNTGTRTAQLTITEPSPVAATMWDGTAKAHNASYDHEFGTTTRRLLAGDDTLKCTISGDPGASGYVIDVLLDLYGREG
jgi:hypothetical protein